MGKHIERGHYVIDGSTGEVSYGSQTTMSPALAEKLGSRLCPGLILTQKIRPEFRPPEFWKVEMPYSFE